MNDTDTMCSVCRREVRGESEQFEMVELCSECGENPVVPGHELCAFCLKEQARRDDIDNDEEIQHEPASIEIDSVSTMDEIELDIGGGLDDEDFSEDADFGPLHESVRKIVKNVLEKRLPDGICLNVNYPVAETFKGVKICRMARGNWGNEIAKQRHPRGYDYYWMVGSYTNEEPENTDTDNWALKNGFIAITPTRVDVTAYEFMDDLQDWNL